jgi:uncharacterized repeat protein (TIGR01451 family)
MITTTIKTVLITVALMALPTTAFAAGYGDTGYGSPCQPIYGGTSCQNSKLSIDKTVQNPSTNSYVDNMSLSDTKFSPESTVMFHVTVTNTGDTTLSKVKAVDSFPQYLTFVSGNGYFDTNARTFTMNIDSLKPGASQTFELKAQIAKESDLPANAVFCLTNTASVTDGTTPAAVDNTQFCVQKTPGQTTKGGLPIYPSQPVKSTPSTGAEGLIVMALPSLFAAGSLLRKRSSK